MMQIRVMGHAGVMAGIHGSTLALLSSCLRAGKSAKNTDLFVKRSTSAN